MTLVDSSVWIDWFRAGEDPHVHYLDQCIEQDETLAICGINLTEVLQGIADDLNYERVYRQLAGLVLLPLTRDTLVDAANIFRVLRRSGITIRKTNDCIIAAAAMEHGCQLLHNDRDFTAIARHLPLSVVV